MESGDASNEISSEVSVRKDQHDLSWKEYRKQKRERIKKWKEMRLLKKLEETKAKEKNVSQQNGDNTTETSNPRGRKYTVSIAVPGSILDNAQSAELKTYLAGQVARAAAVFNVDEIVVFDEYAVTRADENLNSVALKMGKKLSGCQQLVRILQFLECPQYLRKYFFPLHSDLEYAGLLNPLDIPHHLRVDEESKYREGVVMNKPTKEGKGSFVYIGLRKTAIIDKSLTPSIRVTVKLDDIQTMKRHLKGKAVSPSAPCRRDGLYWGYNVRFARSLSAVFSECSYKEGYDLTIGTSEKGDSVDSLSINPFKHLLVVFGGLKGLETCIETDEAINDDDPSSLFHHYLNTCPDQGSRTIRTEEAILITMSALRPVIVKSQQVEGSGS